MVTILQDLESQWLALVTFFAFPIIQYILLKISSRKEGQPELWYLPAYGFRLVLRNLPRKRTLTEIKYRSFLRRVIDSSAGSSVATLSDEQVSEGEEMVLFPGVDQILLAFRLDRTNEDVERGVVQLVITDKLGSQQSAIEVGHSDRLICDYLATVQNFFNFDVQLGKRAEIYGGSIISIFDQVSSAGVEQKFSLDRIRNIQLLGGVRLAPRPTRDEDDSVPQACTLIFTPKYAYHPARRGRRTALPRTNCRA